MSAGVPEPQHTGGSDAGGAQPAVPHAGHEVPGHDLAPVVPIEPSDQEAEASAEPPLAPARANPPQIGVRFADLPSPVPMPSRLRRVVIIVVVLVLAAAAFAGGLWWADSQRNAATDPGPNAETVLVLASR